jgi:hypothetical protein
VQADIAAQDHDPAPLEKARPAVSLLKFFLRPIAGISRTQPANTPTWEEDPLRHPEVERMSLREIADLPLGDRFSCRGETAPGEMRVTSC